jgi:hypothetical protein
VALKEPGGPAHKTEESPMTAILTLVVPMFVLMLAVAVPMAGIRVLERKLG